MCVFMSECAVNMKVGVCRMCFPPVGYFLFTGSDNGSSLEKLFSQIVMDRTGTSSDSGESTNS